LELTDTHLKSLADTHKNEVDDFKKLMEGFVRSIWSIRSAVTTAAQVRPMAGRLNIGAEGNITLKLDPDGFPILPEEWHQDCSKKAVAERLWTAFMNKHYGM
jgi:hypothetical protein